MTLPDLTVEGVFDAAVCTFDGFNYLTPEELRLTMAAVADRLRPAGWLVFDLHTDAMMDFTISHGVVAGQAAENDFVISSVVDPSARTCDTKIVLTRPRDGDPFCERHRQYFHTDADVRASLQDAGFAVTAVSEEYTHQPARRRNPARDLDRTAIPFRLGRKPRAKRRRSMRQLAAQCCVCFSLDDVSDDFDADDDEGEHDERGRPAAGEEWSDEREDEQGARGDAVGRQAVLQDGLRGAARLDGATSVTDEPDSDQHYEHRG